jgi:hypothetical protein
MSLERLVKEFAERVRAELLARIEAEKNNDTAIVKWQGFNDDGKAIVKNLDKIDTAKGVGNVAQKKGTKLIYDKNGSVEYRKRKKEEPALIKKQDIITSPRRRRMSRAPLLTADLFPEVIIKIFDIPTEAFYVIIYSTEPIEDLTSYTNDVYSDGNLPHDTSGWYNYFYTDETSTVTPPSFEPFAPGSTGTVWRLAAGIVSSFGTVTAGSTGTGSASVSGMGLSLSVSATGNTGATGNARNVYDLDIGYSLTQTNDKEDIQLAADGSYVTVQPYNFSIATGRGYAVARYSYIFFEAAVYYFQMSNDKIREIDLNSLVPNKVFLSKIIHNYTAREDDNVFVYAIFQAVDVDMTQSDEVINYDLYNEKETTVSIGKMTRYTIHTRLNMNTGKYESKVNASPNTGINDIVNGGFKDYENGQDYISDRARGTWLLRLVMEARFPSHPAGVGGTYGNGVGIYKHAFMSSFNSFHDPNANLGNGFNPEHIWKESYEGDWLYAYKDIVWNTVASANITEEELWTFLQLSYKDSFFYSSLDSTVELAYQSALPTILDAELERKDPKGSGREGNTPLYGGTYQDIENLGVYVTSQHTNYDIDMGVFSDYLDGSRPNFPNDYSDWRQWTALRSPDPYGYLISGNVNTVDYTLQFPNWTLSPKVYESGSYWGSRLSWKKLYFSIATINSLGLISYEITTETIGNVSQQVVTLITVSDGYLFNPGDLVQISEFDGIHGSNTLDEIADIDSTIGGLYEVYQVNSNTQLKVILPGSTNTSGPVSVDAILFKLPPLP